MCETNDGFKIAETDLQLRGPGDAEGTRQSGMLDLKISDISRDQQIVLLARDSAIRILKEDPKLTTPKNISILKKLTEIMTRKGEWGRIS
jgi:ATP-dependent DNA helicase RecG